MRIPALLNRSSINWRDQCGCKYGTYDIKEIAFPITTKKHPIFVSIVNNLNSIHVKNGDMLFYMTHN